MRHLKELISQEVSNYEAERKRIQLLFESTDIVIRDGWGLELYQSSYKGMSERSFTKAPFRGTAITIDDFILRYKEHWDSQTLDGLLTYAEIILNIVLWADKDIGKYKEAKQVGARIIDNITVLVERAGYEIVKDGDEYAIVRSDALAADLAEMCGEEDVREAIMAYNRLDMRGDVAGKRKLLMTISRTVEPITDDGTMRCKCPEIFDDVKFGMNNLKIRHNNEEGKSRKPALKMLDEDELETAYDDLYVAMIVLLRIAEYGEGHDRMEKLRKMFKKEG